MFDNQQQDHLNYIQEPVKNAVASLVLGILSIVTCILYGIPSIILGIITLAISNGPKNDYKASPELYDKGSFNQLNAGRICAIIGVSLSVAFWLILIIAFMVMDRNFRY